MRVDAGARWCGSLRLVCDAGCPCSIDVRQWSLAPRRHDSAEHILGRPSSGLRFCHDAECSATGYSILQAVAERRAIVVSTCAVRVMVSETRTSVFTLFFYPLLNGENVDFHARAGMKMVMGAPATALAACAYMLRNVRSVFLCMRVPFPGRWTITSIHTSCEAPLFFDISFSSLTCSRRTSSCQGHLEPSLS